MCFVVSARHHRFNVGVFISKDESLGREYQYGAAFRQFTKEAFNCLLKELASAFKTCTNQLLSQNQAETNVFEFLRKVIVETHREYDWMESRIHTDGAHDVAHSSHCLLLSSCPTMNAQETTATSLSLAEEEGSAMRSFVEELGTVRGRMAKSGCSPVKLLWVDTALSKEVTSPGLSHVNRALKRLQSEVVPFAAVILMDALVGDIFGLKKHRASSQYRNITSPIMNSFSSPIMFQSPVLSTFSLTPPTPSINTPSYTPGKAQGLRSSSASDSVWVGVLDLQLESSTRHVPVMLSPVNVGSELLAGEPKGTILDEKKESHSSEPSSISAHSHEHTNSTDKDDLTISMFGMIGLSQLSFGVVESDQLFIQSYGPGSSLFDRFLRLLWRRRSAAIVNVGSSSCSAVLIALTASVARLVTLPGCSFAALHGATAIPASSSYWSSSSILRQVLFDDEESNLVELFRSEVDHHNLAHIANSGILEDAEAKMNDTKCVRLRRKYENALQNFLSNVDSSAEQKSVPFVQQTNSIQCSSKREVLSMLKGDVSRSIADLSNPEVVKTFKNFFDTAQKRLEKVEDVTEEEICESVVEYVKADLIQSANEIFKSTLSKDDKRDQYKKQVILRLSSESLCQTPKDPIRDKMNLKAELAYMSFSMLGKEDPSQFRRFVDEAILRPFGDRLPKTIKWIYDHFFTCEPAVEEKRLMTPLKGSKFARSEIGSSLSRTQKRRLPGDSGQCTKKRRVTSGGKEAEARSTGLQHGSVTKTGVSDSPRTGPKAGSGEKVTGSSKASFQVDAVLRTTGGAGSLKVKRKLTLNHFTSGMSNMKALFKEVSYPQGSARLKRSLSENIVPNRTSSDEILATGKPRHSKRDRERVRRFRKHQRNDVISETPARSTLPSEIPLSSIQPTPLVSRRAHSRDLFRSLPETPRIPGSNYSKRARALRRSATVVAETPMQAQQRQPLRRSSSQLLWSSDDEA